jgi:hypothetical protein
VLCARHLRGEELAHKFLPNEADSDDAMDPTTYDYIMQNE